jgi:transcriptional regulator with XRE-family HTH domain
VRIILDTDLSPTEVIPTDSVNMALGHRLRVLREAFGLSQRELAKRAGVTNSNISMIEQGQISPSVQSLSKILDAFPISLAEFFSCNLISNQSPVVRAKDMSSYTSMEGILIQQLDQNGLTGQVQVSRLCFPARVANGMKSAVQDIAGWVLSGELDLHLATQVYKVRKGDGFYIKREHIYKFANTQLEMVELIVASIDLDK